MAKMLASGMRLEVLLDGRRLAIAGVEDFGVISAIVTRVKRHPSKLTAAERARPEFDEAEAIRESCEITVGGLNSGTEMHFGLARESLKPGSEITIRVLGPGEFDGPRI